MKTANIRGVVRPLSLPGWLRGMLVVPRGETARRLTLVGCAVALQDLLELPRDAAARALGQGLISVLVVLALTSSLAFLIAALRPRAAPWRWVASRPIQALVLSLMLAAVPTGIVQIGRALVAGFQPPQYQNDGTTLDHYAALQLLEGHNPYVTTDIVSAVRLLQQDPRFTTPLRRGAFAPLPATDYPTPAALRAAFAPLASGQPSRVSDFETHVSYPALAVLALVPFVWAGMPSVVFFFALCFLTLAGLLLAAVPPSLRLWIALLIVADAPLLDATAAGDLDVFYVLLLFVAWRWWRRPVMSAVALGLACAAKQLAWFYLPMYLILVWRARGWRAAVGRLAGAGVVFGLINGPFVLANARAWLSGIFAPALDPMFPMGNGLIRLSLGGLLPLAPSVAYTGLEALAAILCVAWYWRHGHEQPEMGYLFAVLPLYFAWRSLTTYFYFIAVPAVVLLFAHAHAVPKLAVAPSTPVRTPRGTYRLALERARVYGKARMTEAWSWIGASH